MSITISEYDWVKQVPLSMFSNKALIIAARFARALRTLNGQQITLQDQNLAIKIVRQVSENNDPKLRLLFDELVSELGQFAQTRDQARYRGTVQTVHDKNSNMGKSTKADQKKVVMYRGVVVTVDQASSKNNAKKSFYRGVEVEG